MALVYTRKADRKRLVVGAWVWHAVEVVVYGCRQGLRVVAYAALWPRVLGPRAVRVVVTRDPSGRMRDCYLFTTDLSASDGWVTITLLFTGGRPHYKARVLSGPGAR